MATLTTDERWCWTLPGFADLSVRARKGVRRMCSNERLSTLEALLAVEDHCWRAQRNVGQLTVREITEWLFTLGKRVPRSYEELREFPTEAILHELARRCGTPRY